MRLAQKLILYALAVALLPLAATGFGLIRLGEDALRARIADHQKAASVAVAAKVSQAVEDLARRIETVMSLVVVTDLSVPERVGVVRMLYRQSPDISVAALVDVHRNLLCQPEFLGAADLVGELAGHPAARAEDAVRLLEVVPLPRAAQRGASVLMSPVYFPEDGAARVALAVPCCADARGRPRAFAAVEIALRRDVLRVEGIDTGPQSSIFVVDSRGRVIAHPSLPVGTDTSQHGAVAAFLARRVADTAVVKTHEGVVAAASAPVGKLGWGVIVEQPEAVAYRAAAEMRQRILVLILSTVALVLVTGLIFASRLRRVLAVMMAGARAFGEGRLGRRIRVKSSDEIGELAKTMNTMAERLEHSARELEQWSLMLESRVEERTRELKQTHAQLLTQSKLAAIGQLGAGVAHEVNNPLAGVLGLVQLMMRNRSEDDPDLRKLKDIETGAKRCKDIVMRLLRFSERRMAGRMRVSLNDVLDEVLDMMQDSLQKSDIEIERHWDVNLPTPTVDPGQLAQVFINILQNAQNAMPKGGELRVTTAAAGADHVMAIVSDTGEGIEPDHLPRVFDPFFTTKRVWTDVGLGLSVAHRIVSDHGGRIEVESELGRGSTLTVVLPLEPPARVDEDLPPRKTILLD